MVLIKCHHVLFHPVRPYYVRVSPDCTNIWNPRTCAIEGHRAVLQAFDFDLISMSSRGTV